jgi:hypothetical protein
VKFDTDIHRKNICTLRLKYFKSAFGNMTAVLELEIMPHKLKIRMPIEFCWTESTCNRKLDIINFARNFCALCRKRKGTKLQSYRLDGRQDIGLRRYVCNIPHRRLNCSLH